MVGQGEPCPLLEHIAKKYTVRMTPITKEECESGEKFYYVLGENFDDEDDREFEKVRRGQITWVEEPFYNEGMPGPKIGGSELTAFDPYTGMYGRYPDWSEHFGLILLRKPEFQQ